MGKLENLYQDKIRELAKNPYNFYELKDATHVFTAYNPLCGDKFTFYLRLDKGKISKSAFHGYGCAISKASSSILTLKLQGKSMEELTVLINDFFLTMKDYESSTRDNDLALFIPVQEFPERRSCVTLGWDELNDQLTKNKLIQ